MAMNIPMPSLPGDALLKGVDTGSNMFAKIMNAKYNNSLHPSGDVANAMYVEQLKNQYGEDDPRYLQAKAAHDMAMSGHQSLIDYRDILNQTAGLRSSTTLGKSLAEGKGQGGTDIVNANRQGKVPQGAVTKVGEQYYNAQGQPIYPDEGGGRTPEEQEAYERSINKQTGDADARNTYLRAQNLDKTRQSINPQDLTRYSGKPMDLFKEFTNMALGGQPSEDYINYSKAVNSASLMADQMRQFYKDSIQPSAMDRLRELSNPSKWYKNQDVAIAQWQQLNDILDKETATYKKAGTSPVKFKIDYDPKTQSFFTEKGKQETKEGKQSALTQSEDAGLLAEWGPQLIQINPQWTPEAIKSTAKETGLNIGQVIEKLMAKGK